MPPRSVDTERDDALDVMIEYGTALFDASTVERLAGHLEVLLAASVAEPGRPVAELPLLTGEGHRELLAGWRGPRRPRPALAAHQLFARQAALRPAPEVVTEGTPPAWDIAAHMARSPVWPPTKLPEVQA